ncbi:hypothetical protein AV530_011292 [Patagioenas fasciata monilis]|uniref:Uncharacterized protein n=1 Tax=Patagioenas fasciata monilis TaxID=372326 RepID=A0A1V4KNV6_PATFA|nr:hypothetical protein AV530_011292 [Patagioenas fasciata monilis]
MPHCVLREAGDQHPAPVPCARGQPGCYPANSSHPARRKLPVVAAYTHCTAGERARSEQHPGSWSSLPHAARTQQGECKTIHTAAQQ